MPHKGRNQFTQGNGSVSGPRRQRKGKGRKRGGSGLRAPNTGNGNVGASPNSYWSRRRESGFTSGGGKPNTRNNRISTRRSSRRPSNIANSHFHGYNPTVQNHMNQHGVGKVNAPNSHTHTHQVGNTGMTNRHTHRFSNDTNKHWSRFPGGNHQTLNTTGTGWPVQGYRHRHNNLPGTSGNTGRSIGRSRRVRRNRR
tara:strand:+ start:1402 stop:1992 length:591 start_codon:yes stop_codon:yes gene_type:complete